MNMFESMKSLLRDEKGATAVEYGLIIALVVLGMLTALQEVATSTISMWNGVDADVQDAIGP